MSISDYLILLIVLPLVAFGSVDVSAAQLKAGVARVDLTPPMRMKSPLGGYGARMNRPAEGVHDRIFAKALVLTDGEQKFALVTADLLGLAPSLKTAVVGRLAEHGWSAAQILLLPSHSHASIDMNALNPNNIFNIPQIGIHNQELYEFTIDNFVRLIQNAEKTLVPVAIGTARRKISDWNRNRRSGEDVTDEELTITRIDSLSDGPLAVLVNFTAHPTFLSDKEMLFSGGWPGHLQRTVEAVVGRGATVMYFNGAEGDQSPRSRPESGDSRWEMAERYGRELGLLVAREWNTISTEGDVAFSYHLQEIELPPRCWHPDFMSTGGEEYGLNESLLRDMLPRMFPENTTSGSLRLGELVIVGVPGEMAAGLGLKLKAETARITGAAHPVIGGLANEWISYILSAEAYEAGGYEASVSFYGPELGERIVHGALDGVRQLHR